MSDGTLEPVVRLRSTALEWRAVDGEIVALDLDTLEYLHVNRSGVGLWRLLAEGATRLQLTRHLEETYGLSAADAAADLEKFLDTMAANGLLQA